MWCCPNIFNIFRQKYRNVTSFFEELNLEIFKSYQRWKKTVNTFIYVFLISLFMKKISQKKEMGEKLYRWNTASEISLYLNSFDLNNSNKIQIFSTQFLLCVSTTYFLIFRHISPAMYFAEVLFQFKLRKLRLNQWD